ncbi:hypothetical protein [Mycetocola miduiensis]|uniref:Uncharacterized protein n=1 Tax=Mycetocola miduiensis TaxID=995034 RepID=A0A1I5ATZ5_9MICO|nr:hypothetical protein [Mycetocola miduiensis]SFN65913.1 hypothetical protein SAMN05216219_1540 [Mycetocola miduiensis]
MTAQDWALIITAIGGGALLKELVVWARRAFTGSASKRRSEVDRIAAEAAHERRLRRAAEKNADSEATKRRIIQEYASRLRSAYYEAGRTPEAWPEIEKTLTPEEVMQLRTEE